MNNWMNDDVVDLNIDVFTPGKRYVATVRFADKAVSKKGSPQIAIEWDINGESVKSWYTIEGKALLYARHVISCLGINPNDQFQIQSLVGRKADVTLKKNGRNYWEVDTVTALDDDY